MKIKHPKSRKINRDETPDWLKSIQLNSWEAELLVSALLLYVLFQVPEWMEVYFRKAIQPGNLLKGFANVMIDSIKLIRLGYSLHILIRGIWVATVGLSYVFPEGLSRKKLRFKGKFDRELENHEKLDGFVMTLEKLASVIYGLSFMLFGIYLGTFSMFLILAVVSEYGFMRSLSNDFGFLAILSSGFMTIYLGCVIILFVDFITNGLLRRDRSTAKWFYYLAKFFRVISFSILYRRSMLVILSNLPILWRRLLPFLVIICIASYWYFDKLISDYNMDKYYSKPAGYILAENYESQRDYGDLTRVTIPDVKIDDDVLEVFLRDIGILGTAYKKQRGIDFWVKWDQVDPIEKSEFLQKMLKIDIDSSYFLSAEWLDGKNKYNYLQGFYGYLDLKDIPDGYHHLNIYLNQETMDSLSVREYNPERIQIANIPFYLNKP